MPSTSIHPRWPSLYRLRALPRRRRLLLLEAALWLIVARLAILVIPFPRIARRLGQLEAPTVDSSPPGPARSARSARDIAWAIERSARALPVNLVCFPRALAAWQMLARRRIPARLHFGASPNPVRPHAWLTAAEIEVTGYPEAHACTEVARFSRGAPAPAKRQNPASALLLVHGHASRSQIGTGSLNESPRLDFPITPVRSYLKMARRQLIGVPHDPGNYAKRHRPRRTS